MKTQPSHLAPTAALFDRLAKAHEERGQKDAAESARRAAAKVRAITTKRVTP